MWVCVGVCACVSVLEVSGSPGMFVKNTDSWASPFVSEGGALSNSSGTF